MMRKSNNISFQTQKEEIDLYCLSLIGKYVTLDYCENRYHKEHVKLFNYDGNRVIILGNSRIPEIKVGVVSLSLCNCSKCREKDETKEKELNVLPSTPDLGDLGSY
jgi:hypothetical protein